MTPVEITHVGYQTLRMLARYMAQHIGLENALKLASQLIATCENKLANNPESCPVWHELEMLGVTEYQRLTIDKYKVLYRYDKASHRVFITAFKRHRQSARQRLIDHSLLTH